MADGEERPVPDSEIAAPVWPLAGIAAGVTVATMVPIAIVVAGTASVPMLPVIAYYAVIGAIVAAVAAATVGGPTLLLARRLGFCRAWQAIALGALAAAVAPVLPSVLGALVRSQYGAAVGTSGALPRMMLGAFRDTGSMFAPFGAASGFLYWARYIAPASWPGRHIQVTWLLVLLITASVFGVRARAGSRTADVRARDYIATQQRLASPRPSISVRLARVADSSPDVVVLMSYARPSCALVFRSEAMAAAIGVGSDVWVDVGGTGAPAAAAQLMITKVGTVTDPALLSRSEIRNCQPW